MKMIVETIKLLRSDESFQLFWLKVNQRSDSHGIDEPRLPRLHKQPRRFDEVHQRVIIMKNPSPCIGKIIMKQLT